MRHERKVGLERKSRNRRFLALPDGLHIASVAGGLYAMRPRCPSSVLNTWPQWAERVEYSAVPVYSVWAHRTRRGILCVPDDQGQSRRPAGFTQASTRKLIRASAGCCDNLTCAASILGSPAGLELSPGALIVIILCERAIQLTSEDAI